MTSVPGWLPPIVAAIVLLALLVTLIVQLRRLVALSAAAPESPLALGPAVWIVAALVLVACGVLGYLLGVSTQQGRAISETLAVSATLLRSLFFAAVTIILLQLFIRESVEERRPRIETNWGGLGGGLGGWAVSRSLIYLTAAVLFGALTALTSYPSVPAPQASQARRTDRQHAQSSQQTAGQQQGSAEPAADAGAPPQGSKSAPAQQQQPAK